MRKYAVFAGLLFVMLWPSAASAQGDPPPPCCPRGPSIAPVDETRATPVSLSTFPASVSTLYASEGTLQSLGITRSQFLERLSQGLFPGSRVDVVVMTSRLVRTNSRMGRTAADEAGEVAVEERRYYRLPTDGLRTQPLNTFDELYLTDGEVYLKVTFTREAGHAVP